MTSPNGSKFKTLISVLNTSILLSEFFEVLLKHAMACHLSQLTDIPAMVPGKETIHCKGNSHILGLTPLLTDDANLITSTVCWAIHQFSKSIFVH